MGESRRRNPNCGAICLDTIFLRKYTARHIAPQLGFLRRDSPTVLTTSHMKPNCGTNTLHNLHVHHSNVLFKLSNRLDITDVLRYYYPKTLPSIFENFSSVTHCQQVERSSDLLLTSLFSRTLRFPHWTQPMI